MSNSFKDTIATQSSPTDLAAQPDDTAVRQHTSTHPRIVQHFLLIWLVSNIDELNDDCRNSITQIRHIVNTIETFTDVDQCVDFLTEIQYEKVFMIVSGTVGQYIVPLIHNVFQLNSIYIFCEDKSSHEQWTKEWPKVKDVFIHFDSICELLKQAAHQCDQNSISMSIIQPNEVSIQNFQQIDQSFMYTQLLKDVVLEFPYNEEILKALTAYCRDRYIENSHELNIIDKFEREYELQSPIWWYTYAGFLYPMLNRALRTQEIETILMMAFFVRALHQQIERLHSEQSDNHQVPLFTVYRGQGMLNAEFEKIKKSQGGLLSFNNFLSTSIDQDVSFAFAESNASNPDLTGILFKMNINPSISSVPFARLDNVSYYKDSEREILFSMHTVFRINEIKQLDTNNQVWQVELTLISDNDQELSALTQLIRDETRELPGLYRLGELMNKLGQFYKAEEVFRLWLGQTSDDEEKVCLYNQLGYSKTQQGDYIEAISFYEKSLDLYQRTFDSDHPFLSKLYNNIAYAYDQMNEYSKAVSLYEKVLEIRQINLLPDHPDLATSYNNLGSVYDHMGEYSKALSFFEKGLEIRQKILLHNHPDLAASYNNIAAMYNTMSEYPKALSFHEKALEIFEKILPRNHPNMAISYNNIGGVYASMGEYSKALSFYEKALQIRQTSLASNHPDVATSYNNIGYTYYKMNEYTKALSFYQKSLEIRHKVLPPNHSDFNQSFNNIGSVFQQMGDYSKAILFYEKSIEIYEKILAPNHPDLATVYNNIGYSYYSTGEYVKALSSYKKSLEILLKTLPSNHPHLATSCNNIGQVCYQMSMYSQAIFFYEKSIKICQETLSPDHLHFATYYNNIGMVYNNMEEYSKALSFYEKAVEICQNARSPDNLVMATSYNNIGLVYYNMEEYSKALSFFEQAVEIGQRFLSPNHPDYQLYIQNLESTKQKL